LRREDDGAVVAMVAVCLFVLLSMLVLTFDLGRTVSVRRDMVNASDAAALAAAQACARGDGYGAAQFAAGSLITENTANLDPTTMAPLDAPQCDTLDGTLKFAKVLAETNVDYYFAQILGMDSHAVRSTATAAWGPAIGVANPVPLRLLDASVEGCIGTPENPRPIGYSGPECAFGFDNTDQNSQSASQWGILDFPEGWPDPPGPNPMACDSQSGGSNDVIDYLSGITGDFFPVLWAPAVYVCAEGGISANVMNWMINWLIEQAALGTSLIFPVMGDPAVYPPILSSGGEAYPIVGFVSLTVLGAWRGQEARQHCEFEANNASVFCIQFQYEGLQVGQGIPGNGTFYNLQVTRLVE
jgi:Flp pilus assembly protein TadG